MSTSSLAGFIEQLPAALHELRATVQAVNQPDLLPLDLSYESLDRLEDYYRLRLDGAAPADELQRLHGWLLRYIGATLIEHTGGIWKPSRSSSSDPVPVVGKLPHVTGRDFEPLGPVLDFKRLRSPGLLRDATERWDIALRRATLTRLTARIDDEIAMLRGDVAELTGSRVDVLDGSSAALGVVEAALKRLVAINAPREQRRRVRCRTGLLLGTVIARALGRGEWLVCAEAENVDFGEFTINGWAPSNAVRIGPKTRDNHLYLCVTSRIERAHRQ